jgi:hypothetical protein
MKHLKQLSMSILIISTLFLCGKNIGAQEIDPQLQSLIHGSREDDSANSKSIATDQPSSVSSSVISTAEPSQPAPNVYQDRSKENWFWPPLPSSCVLILVTGAYTVISFYMLGAIRKQAEQLAKMEAPFLSLDFRFNTLAPNGIPTGDVCVIDFWFINNGRTPATLSDMATTFCLDNKLPVRPDYAKERTPEFGAYPPDVVVIAPNGGTTKPGRVGAAYDPIDATAIRLQQKCWFLYEFVRYKDSACNERVLGFGYEFDVRFGGLSIIDSPAYNYHRIP